MCMLVCVFVGVQESSRLCVYVCVCVSTSLQVCLYVQAGEVTVIITVFGNMMTTSSSEHQTEQGPECLC